MYSDLKWSIFKFMVDISQEDDPCKDVTRHNAIPLSNYIQFACIVHKI